MECLLADARRPQQRGQLGRLLARLGAARLGVVRRRRQDLGHRQRRQLGRLLTRLGAARLGIGRRHCQDLGHRQRCLPVDAEY